MPCICPAPRGRARILNGAPVTRLISSSGTRIDGIGNLYIAGSGRFPAEGSVNPTFTLQALALRTADHLVADRPDLFANG